MPTSGDDFFSRIPGFADFRQAVEPERYRPLPPDWLVVITDVRGSTKAIQDGRYKDVNALGVASIVAVLNAVRPMVIPFVFGGDGATLCLPQACREAVVAALAGTRQLASEVFGLDLRTGLVPMARLTRDDKRILVGAYQPSPHFRQAMFLGDGLSHAEHLVKDPAPDNPYLLTAEVPGAGADFSGFECRWKEIASPRGETVSLIVQALGDAVRIQATYAAVLAEIAAIYGDDEQCRPLCAESLNVTSSTAGLAVEVRLKTARSSRLGRWWYGTRLRLRTWIGRQAMQRGLHLQGTDWGAYRAEVVANTDHRKIDEVLRMVISGTSDQRHRLREAFGRRRDRGELCFGIHAASTALMTCVIGGYTHEHVHFLDASNGGYALAAKEMKEQIREKGG